MLDAYSPDFLRRATVEDCADGVEVSFWKLRAIGSAYGDRPALTEPPGDGVWRLEARQVLDVPMHVAISHAYDVLR